MTKKPKITVGSRVKNILTKEVGIVLEIIGSKENPFGYIVQTQEGVSRWIIRKVPKKS